MKAPSLSHDEPARLAALHGLALLDTPSEERFDRITRLARRLFGVPIATLSLVDEDRQWFKSRQGLELSETPREISFCGHAILGDQIMEVPDAAADPRFHDNPLVTQEPHVRFYAGCPLRAPDGSKLSRIAYVDRTDDPAMAHFAELAARNRGVNVRLFLTVDAATLWLSGDDRASSQDG